jgi:hypothetical protein
VGDRRAVEPYLAERPRRVAEEESGDDRLGYGSLGAPWSSRRGSAKQTTRVEVVSNGWRTT